MENPSSMDRFTRLWISWRFRGKETPSGISSYMEASVAVMLRVSVSVCIADTISWIHSIRGHAGSVSRNMLPFNPMPATFSNGMQPESAAAISYSGQDSLPWVQTGPDRSLLLLIEQTFFLPALQSHPQSPARLWLQGWGHSEREFHFP